MKQLFFLLLAMATGTCFAQQHKLEKIWETDTVVAVPESVLPVGNILYVSQIDGGGWVADGKGGVGKIGRDGKIIDLHWITGLNAPKGLGIYQNRLYAADISEVVVIDIKKGKIEKKIRVDDANGLNDITVTDKGVVFVSDTKQSKVWRIENDIPTLYLDGMKSANGLKVVKDGLVIGAGKDFLKADAQKKVTKIADVPQPIDGIEPVGNGDFIVTAWSGWVFYVYANGTVDTLLETHEQKKNTADIGYDPVKRIVYIPSFNGKTVAAYKLL
ncbi:hypothetical protein [Asinibacterium sp. OR53]|uniref:hypothetical protein n=1 Tax=Asinibacterium sp. OR53 TaxID=925409 RepID=UPI00047BAC8B|nr:hypothetical protein [Asinibacterium sp. OR53]